MRTFARLARPLLASAQAVSTRSTALSAPSIARLAPSAASSLRLQQQARFASGGALSREDISSRILEVLKSFEKVDPAKVDTASSFTKDLGLDSLDAVEVVMAIEEEFSIEIPDEEADAISTVGEAIDYISKTPDAH